MSPKWVATSSGIKHTLPRLFKQSTMERRRLISGTLHLKMEFTKRCLFCVIFQIERRHFLKKEIARLEIANTSLLWDHFISTMWVRENKSSFIVSNVLEFWVEFIWDWNSGWGSSNLCSSVHKRDLWLVWKLHRGKKIMHHRLWTGLEICQNFCIKL